MIHFPPTPGVGQTYTSPDGIVWIWDGTKWKPGTTGGAFLPITGGTLTGSLTLANDPVSNLGAATKQYVDNNLSSNLSNYLPLSGGTMTGPINNGVLNYPIIFGEVDGHYGVAGEVGEVISVANSWWGGGYNYWEPMANSLMLTPGDWQVQATFYGGFAPGGVGGGTCFAGLGPPGYYPDTWGYMGVGWAVAGISTNPGNFCATIGPIISNSNSQAIFQVVVWNGSYSNMTASAIMIGRRMR